MNTEDPQAVAEGKRLDRERATLVDALYRKGRALGYRELPEVLNKHPLSDPAAHDKAFEANFAELQTWVDTTEKNYVLLHVRRERRKERFGKALELLNRYIARADANYWYFKKRRDLYKRLGWTHLAQSESKWLVIRFPGGYEPF